MRGKTHYPKVGTVLFCRTLDFACIFELEIWNLTWQVSSHTSVVATGQLHTSETFFVVLLVASFSHTQIARSAKTAPVRLPLSVVHAFWKSSPRQK